MQKSLTEMNQDGTFLPHSSSPYSSSPYSSSDSGRDSPSEPRLLSPDSPSRPSFLFLDSSTRITSSPNTTKKNYNWRCDIQEHDNKMQKSRPIDQPEKEAKHYLSTDNRKISDESTDTDLPFSNDLASSFRKKTPTALLLEWTKLSPQGNQTTDQINENKTLLSQIVENFVETQKDKHRQDWKNRFLIEDLPVRGINSASITSLRSLDFLDLAMSFPASNPETESNLTLSILDVECYVYESYKVSTRRLQRYWRPERDSHAAKQSSQDMTSQERLLGKLYYDLISKLIIAYFWQRAYAVKTATHSFDKLLMEIGFYLNLEWCIRIAVRFSRGSSIDLIGEFLSKQCSTDKIHLVLTAFTEIKNVFKSRFQSLYNIIHMSIGHFPSCQPLDVQCNTIAVITRGNIDKTAKINRFYGLSILFRDENEFSEEAAALLKHERHGAVNIEISPRTKTDLFKAHSNITILSASNVISRRFSKRYSTIQVKPCVVIYCRIKGFIPFGEQIFPSTIEGYPVDVREGACTFAVKNENCLRIGDRIGPAERNSGFGTLGGFVDIGGNNPSEKAFITCAHVVCSNELLRRKNLSECVAKNDITVVDKYLPDGQNAIGVVSRAVFQEKSEGQVSVDAALIKIINKAPEDGEFTHRITADQLRSAGFSDYNKPSFFNGETISISPTNFRKVLVKVGAASEMTLGHLLFKDTEAVILNNVDIIQSRDKFHMHGQMEVLPLVDTSRNNLVSPAPPSFITHGDSGSFVFMIEQDCPPILNCVGMAIAVTSYGSCLMTPIDHVLSNLGIPKESMSKFANENFAVKQTKPVTEESLKSILEGFNTEIVATFRDEIRSQKDEIANTNQRVAAIEDTVENIKQTVKVNSKTERKESI